MPLTLSPFSGQIGSRCSLATLMTLSWSGTYSVHMPPCKQFIMQKLNNRTVKPMPHTIKQLLSANKNLSHDPKISQFFLLANYTDQSITYRCPVPNQTPSTKLPDSILHVTSALAGRH